MTLYEVLGISEEQPVIIGVINLTTRQTTVFNDPDEPMPSLTPSTSPIWRSKSDREKPCWQPMTLLRSTVAPD